MEDMYALNKRNYDFLSDHFDTTRWSNIMEYACTRGNFKEVCKAFREICYDQIGYFGEDLKAKIYEDKEKYPQEVLEQAAYLQRKLSTVVDLYEQCITDGRLFDWGYLNERLGK